MIKRFENFHEPNHLQILIEILETELYDDFGFGACRWWKEVGDATGLFREDCKDISCEKSDDFIITEIENRHLRTFVKERLPEFYDDIRWSNDDRYLDLSEEKIANNKFLQRILNLTNYKIEKIYYCSASLSHPDIIGFYFRLNKQ